MNTATEKKTRHTGKRWHVDPMTRSGIMGISDEKDQRIGFVQVHIKPGVVLSEAEARANADLAAAAPELLEALEALLADYEGLLTSGAEAMDNDTCQRVLETGAAEKARAAIAKALGEAGK